MNDLVIIDTDVLIDASRRVSEAIDCLQKIEHESTLAVSAVTQMELFIGCRNKTELRAVQRFLSRFHVIHVNESISEKAVHLLLDHRLSHGLLIADALIAATALSLDQPLATKNQRDYRFIAELRLWPYPVPNLSS